MTAGRVIIAATVFVAAPAMAERSPVTKPLPQWFLDLQLRYDEPIRFPKMPARRRETTRDLILRLQNPRRDDLE